MRKTFAWEQAYIKALIAALNPSGHVLQVGFDEGYAASCIQAYAPIHLTIIEKESVIAQKARHFAQNISSVSVIEKRWEEALPLLGCFDAIFFNEPLLEDVTLMKQKEEKAKKLLSSGKELKAMVDQMVPGLKNIRYSNADLELFLSEKMSTASSQELGRFLAELKENKQITEEQLSHLLEKYRLEGQSVRQAMRDPIFSFLQACLEKHMRQGARFSCFSSHPTSKFEDPEFFDQVITNPQLDYSEELISVDSPGGCSYYPYKEALVLLVKKVS